ALGAIPVAVAAPLSDVALLSVLGACEAKLIEPILVGPEITLKRLAEKLGVELGKWPLVEASDDADAATKAVALCRSGRARMLMKGSLHTDTLLHAVIQ